MMAYHTAAMTTPFTLVLGLSVLVFSKTEGYRHEAIPDGTRALQEIANEQGWQLDTTEDAAMFRDDTLADYDVVVFLMTTGDVLDASQQDAFERFIRKGRGYVGIHSAADTEHEWPWYGKLVGAYFASHAVVQEASYIVEDESHPATRMIPEHWRRLDEHYTFDHSPRGSVSVLMSLDETSFDPGEHAMGDHPIVWHHDYDGGRAFYTALGHTKESYQEPVFRQHLTEAIAWTGEVSKRER